MSQTQKFLAKCFRVDERTLIKNERYLAYAESVFCKRYPNERSYIKKLYQAFVKGVKRKSLEL